MMSWQNAGLILLLKWTFFLKYLKNHINKKCSVDNKPTFFEKCFYGLNTAKLAVKNFLNFQVFYFIAKRFFLFSKKKTLYLQTWSSTANINCHTAPTWIFLNIISYFAAKIWSGWPMIFGAKIRNYVLENGVGKILQQNTLIPLL